MRIVTQLQQDFYLFYCKQSSQFILQYLNSNKDYIQFMQANCCIFPAPSQYALNKIVVSINMTQSKLVLIPKNIQEASGLTLPAAQYYIDKHITQTQNDQNQFMRLVRSKGDHAARKNNSTQQTNNPQANSKKFQVYSASLKQKADKISNMIKSSPIVLDQKYDETNTTKVCNQIPCLFLPSYRTDKLMVFFHGNGEDLSTCFQFASFINKELNIPVLAVEYQGYSIYQGQANSENIVRDCRTVMDYLVKSGFPLQDIILFGRSIGGAFAFQIASNYESCCLILLSPFLSLKKVAEDLYGKVASSLLKQTLDNASMAQNVKCPILIIHGLKDTLVPFHHSISILKQCKCYTRLKLAQNMTHTKFNFNHDFIQPVTKFISQLGLRNL